MPWPELLPTQLLISLQANNAPTLRFANPGIVSTGVLCDGDGVRTSEAGLSLIKGFEGCRLEPYYDSVGVASCGYGHTKGVTIDMPSITQAKADSWLEYDVGVSEGTMNFYIKVPLNQNQWDAIASATFNLGYRLFVNQDGSKTHFCNYLNAGEFPQAADALLSFDHAGGKEIAGLLRRREAEKALFLS